MVQSHTRLGGRGRHPATPLHDPPLRLTPPLTPRRPPARRRMRGAVATLRDGAKPRGRTGVTTLVPGNRTGEGLSAGLHGAGGGSAPFSPTGKPRGEGHGAAQLESVHSQGGGGVA